MNLKGQGKAECEIKETIWGKTTWQKRWNVTYNLSVSLGWGYGFMDEVIWVAGIVGILEYQNVLRVSIIYGLLKAKEWPCKFWRAGAAPRWAGVTLVNAFVFLEAVGLSSKGKCAVVSSLELASSLCSLFWIILAMWWCFSVKCR